LNCPRYDFHIHCHYLGCANETMQIPAIVAECERIGVTAMAITDHLNTPDKLDLHRPIPGELCACRTDMDLYFGVELNFMSCDGAFAFNEEVKAELGFQFAVGGIHNPYLDTYDAKKLVDIQHRHHLRVCQDPLVDVLVHPYWFWRRPFEDNGWPPFTSMDLVPDAYARELGQAARDTGTAIEINGSMVPGGSSYVDGYVEYLAAIAEEGAMFSVGSDAHDIGELKRIESTWGVVDQLKLSADRIWSPNVTPINKA